MKPIRVLIVSTQEEGTWIDTVAGEGGVYFVIVLDDGRVHTYLEQSIKVLYPNTVRFRATT